MKSLELKLSDKTIGKISTKTFLNTLAFVKSNANFKVKTF